MCPKDLGMIRTKVCKGLCDGVRSGIVQLWALARPAGGAALV